MSVEDVDVRLLVENLFTATLGIKVGPPSRPCGEAGDDLDWPEHAARVAIHGAFQGSVVLAASARLLSWAVGSMCRVRPDSCSAADLDDALRELVNQVGGCIKALLPEPCRLGLPEPVAAANLPRDGDTLVDRHFLCDGEPLRLWVDGCETAAT